MIVEQLLAQLLAQRWSQGQRIVVGVWVAVFKGNGAAWLGHETTSGRAKRLPPSLGQKAQVPGEQNGAQETALAPDPG